MLQGKHSRLQVERSRLQAAMAKHSKLQVERPSAPTTTTRRCAASRTSCPTSALTSSSSRRATTTTWIRASAPTPLLRPHPPSWCMSILHDSQRELVLYPQKSMPNQLPNFIASLPCAS
eukprot:scaffold104903_cov34-Phaeocystis_antarctica.AAC.1